jgi:glycine hydroxymethyltransferase
MSKKHFQDLLSQIESLEGVDNRIRHQMEGLVQAVIDYEDKSQELLRLIPTEGVLSPAARMLMGFVGNERYLHAPPGDDVKAIKYPDIADLQKIQSICTRSLRAVLNAGFVNVDALSGLQAMEMSLLAFAEAGELILTINTDDGGHKSTAPMAIRFGRKIEYLPFDHENYVIDTEKLDPKLNPALIYVDHSNILRPHNLLALERTYPNAVIMFDISHVFGSIAAQEFPNPLECGAHAIVGSTHKSLNGPQKAVFATNRSELATKYAEVSNELISNNHPGNVAALGMTLLEFQLYGAKYGSQMVLNANKLAEFLHSNGLTVYGFNHKDSQSQYTYTSHVWLDCEKDGWSAEDAAQFLYRRCGIVPNTLYLAKGGKNSKGAQGLRLGTTEVTRIGMKGTQMYQIANMIAKALLLLRNEEPDEAEEPEEVLKSIFKTRLKLRKKFVEVEYCIPFTE